MSRQWVHLISCKTLLTNAISFPYLSIQSKVNQQITSNLFTSKTSYFSMTNKKKPTPLLAPLASLDSWTLTLKTSQRNFYRLNLSTSRMISLFLFLLAAITENTLDLVMFLFSPETANKLSMRSRKLLMKLRSWALIPQI